MKRCPLKSLFPNRRQNQCISRHYHRRQNNDDGVTCKLDKEITIVLPLATIQTTTEDGEIIWRGASGVVGDYVVL